METRNGTLLSATPVMGAAVSPWATLTVLCSSLLILSLDTTVLNVVLPTLVRDLGATSSALQWIVDAYALVFGGLLLSAGSLADRFGRKWTFLIGVLGFAAGSAWAAFSGSVGMLIAARAAMGIGAALMMPSTLSIITDVFRDPAQRQKAIGIWAGTNGVGFALGPIVGGALLARFWWGSIFLINVPIALSPPSWLCGSCRTRRTRLPVSRISLELSCRSSLSARCSGPSSRRRSTAGRPRLFSGSALVESRS